MARYVLLATLLATWDETGVPIESRVTFNDFKNKYRPIPEGDEGIGSEAVKNLTATQVDGANGGGGDNSPAPLPFRISHSKITSQRFALSPSSPRGGALTGTLEAGIKYPINMRSELCLVFNSLAEYRSHMTTYMPLYNSIFGYVTLIRVSEEN